MTARMNPDKAAAFERMYRGGMTQQEIGDVFGVSRQRVQQILRGRDVTAADGGIEAERRLNRRRANARRDAECLRRWGCDYATWHDLMRSGVTRAFQYKRNNARRTGDPWHLTLAEFWHAWHASGRWNDRGRYAGDHCMTRIDPWQPWTANNVEIVTVAEAQKRRRMPERRKPAISPADISRKSVVSR